ncbi:MULTISPECIES: phosphoribosyltransferase [Legionella]|uniref:Phosphoribosyltransferase n=1 Tax=Legionella drozanskii LLAP-1 TaxID=1212489 RepID=A0A0W0SQG6_9GAMM|nr:MULTISPECIES: phosphoribosyltransferase [Legionella]KTC85655.1 phosphoribosyltransferase [Legionella drozanskii LLAP-1]PJE15141.1 MAG: phosphoribosyl transferase [Legionella sp.]
MEKYVDRYEAGKILAEQLKEYANDQNTIVLGLARGGVPVAYEIARTLSLPLDVLIVRKLGVPGHEELAMGAIVTGDAVVFNDEIIHSFHLSDSSIQKVIQVEQKELQRRESLYRQDRPSLNLKAKTVILVDDGIATGASMLAALKAVRLQQPASIIIAVPVAADATCNDLAGLADYLVCPLKPVNFYAVGLWYEDFNQTTDEEIFELLAKTTTNQ